MSKTSLEAEVEAVFALLDVEKKGFLTPDQAKKFIDDCLSAESDRPLIVFSGDSHSGSMFPVSEVVAATSRYDVFSHSRNGCAFPPQGETSVKNCFEVQSSIMNEMIDRIKKREKGSIIIATNYLNSHFGYEGVHRYQFKKHYG